MIITSRQKFYLQAACAAAVCTWKVGNGSMQKSESWAQRTWDHMQGIKNKYCSFSVSQPGECCFHYSSVSFSKKSHCQILVSFHFKSGTCPSFLRPLWNQRRQGQSTEGQKLGFFLLLSLRFSTVREFPSSHWCLVPFVTAGKGTVALCLLMLVSYQSPEQHLQHLQGQQCFWRRATILPQDTQSTPVPHHPFLFGKSRWCFLFPLAVLAPSAASSRSCKQGSDGPAI